jgi:hypothetical protein
VIGIGGRGAFPSRYARLPGSACDVGAELVAVQYNSMRLVVHPPPPDMRGRE